MIRRTAWSLLLLGSLVLGACARHVVVERDAAVQGLGDEAWQIESAPEDGSGED